VRNTGLAGGDPGDPAWYRRRVHRRRPSGATAIRAWPARIVTAVYVRWAARGLLGKRLAPVADFYETATAQQGRPLERW